MSVLTWLYEKEGYKGYGESSRAWKCPLCGDVQQGGDPPRECPYCLAPGRAYVEVGKKSPAPARRTELRNPERPPAPESRALFYKYMKREAGEWTRFIRS